MTTPDETRVQEKDKGIFLIPDFLPIKELLLGFLFSPFSLNFNPLLNEYRKGLDVLCSSLNVLITDLIKLIISKPRYTAA